MIITDEGVQITDEINELIEVWESQSIQMCDEDLKLLQSLIQKLQE